MGLFDWLLPESDSIDADVRTGIERLIPAIDPRFKAISSAPAKLAPAVRIALEFCRRTVAELPGPLDAAPETWRESPELRAMFTRSDELQQIFSRQADIQEFVAAHPGSTHVYAILGAVLQEKKGFGVALNGGALQHDVAVTHLNFVRHRLYMPQSDAAELDQALIWALFDQLALEILTRLSAMKESRADLQEEIAQLRAHLSHVEQQGLGQVFCNGDEAPEPGEDCASLAERLAARLQVRQNDLSQAQRRLLTLDDTLNWVIQNLSRPDNLVDVDAIDYRVDSVNQLVGPEQAGQALHFSHFRFTAPNARQGVILRVRYPIAEMIPRSELSREIERLYG